MIRACWLAALVVAGVAPPLRAQVTVGDTAELSVPALDGTPLSLEGLRGSVVLLDFWATWCVPCRASLPFYADLRARYAERGFEVIAASVDQDREAVDAFVADQSLPFRWVWDADHQVVAAFEPEAMPTCYLIDRAGVVRFVHYGFGLEDRAVIEAELRALLEEPPPDLPIATP